MRTKYLCTQLNSSLEILARTKPPPTHPPKKKKEKRRGICTKHIVNNLME